jgi:hypothetical protein
MVDCDYCGESFEGEDAYLDHLDDQHGDELGAIDQRWVDSRGGDDGSGIPVGIVVVGAVVVLAAGVGLYLTVLGGGGGADGIEASSLDDSGDDQRLQDVEQFESQGREHVADGTDIDYAQTPPLSGPHYNQWAEGGFYEEPLDYGNIVHGLEHGAVVIYYAPDASSEAAGTDDETAEESLQEFAATHNGQWRSVIVVPNPEDEPQADYVLTAWQHRLYMDSYDARTVHAFLSEFLGRGPENPVR